MTPNQKEAYDHMQKALEKLLPMARKHGTLFGSINPWTEACDIGDTAITAVKKVQNELEQSVEPVAWIVYVAEVQNQYAVDDIDDANLVDDCTNHGAEVTPLYLHPPQPKATTPAAPEGYVLVPVELHAATGHAFLEGQKRALLSGHDHYEAIHVGWKAMLKAAQGEKP